MREFLVTNLSTSLEPLKELQYNTDGTLNKMVQIPVGVLIDPLVKQASTHGYNNHDFELTGWAWASLAWGLPVSQIRSCGFSLPPTHLPR